MKRLRIGLARLGGFLMGGSRQRDLDAEIDAHLELLTDEFRRTGLSSDDARRAARREFGGVTQIRETYHERAGWPFATNLARDVRIGVRSLKRAPLFCAAVIGSVALGVAATATIFSFVNALLLRPLPVRNADRLTVFGKVQQDGTATTALSPHDVDVLRTRAPLWSNVVAVSSGMFGLSADGTTDRASVEFVSDNYWEALGLQPSAGQLFRSGRQTGSGVSSVAVLSHDYWQRRFSSRDDAMGRSVAIGGAPVTIVGVAPKGFRGDSAFATVNVFVPLDAPGFRAASRPARVLGFLSPDVTLAVGNASLAALSDAPALDRQAQRDDGRLQASWEQFSRPNPHVFRAAAASEVIFGVLAMLLLALACVNVAGLVLIRAGARRAETALRRALGASRGRLVSLVCAETSLLVLLGAGAGLVLAQWITRGIGGLLPKIFAPFADSLADSFDWRMLAFVVTVVCVTSIAAGLLPALRAASDGMSPGADVPSMSRLAGVNARLPVVRTRGRRAFLVLQIAVALVLLIVSGLFARSLDATRARPFGFDRDEVYDFRLNPAEVAIAGGRAQELLGTILDRVSSIPTITSAALAQSVPMTSTGYSEAVIYADRAPVDGRLADAAGYAAVSPAYFRTLRIQIVEGRSFETSDRANAPRVAIVNRTMAEHYWPGTSAIGRSFRLNNDSSDPILVTGVAADILNYSAIQDSATPYFYLPLAQHPTPSVTLQVRSSAEAASVFRDVNAAIRATSPDVVPFEVETMADALDRAPDGLLLARVGSLLSTGISLAGLILTCIGVYGVVAYAAGQRRREMAIRLALGAGPRDIQVDVLKGGAVITAGGLAVGVALAAAFARVTAFLYVGVSAWDPVTFGGAAIVVAAASMIACYVPARRAMRTDPLVALRD